MNPKNINRRGNPTDSNLSVNPKPTAPFIFSAPPVKNVQPQPTQPKRNKTIPTIRTPTIEQLVDQRITTSFKEFSEKMPTEKNIYDYLCNQILAPENSAPHPSFRRLYILLRVMHTNLQSIPRVTSITLESVSCQAEVESLIRENILYEYNRHTVINYDHLTLTKKGRSLVDDILMRLNSSEGNKEKLSLKEAFTGKK